MEKIQQLEHDLEQVKQQQKQTPSHLEWEQLPEDDKCQRLAPGRKRLLDVEQASLPDGEADRLPGGNGDGDDIARNVGTRRRRALVPAKAGNRWSGTAGRQILCRTRIHTNCG